MATLNVIATYVPETNMPTKLDIYAGDYLMCIYRRCMQIYMLNMDSFASTMSARMLYRDTNYSNTESDVDNSDKTPA